MKTRIIFGLISLALLLAVIMSNNIALISCVVAAVIIVAIWEMWMLIGSKNVWGFIWSSLIIVAGFSCIVLIRVEPSFGKYTIWFPLACAFLTDTFAYIFGMWLGQKNGHKLAPKISPKKSWEGAIGGVVGTTFVMAIWGYILSESLNTEAGLMGMRVGILNLVILAFFASIIAQLGDLAASWVKRKYGVKDYGNLIPGHGGIMDRCDSLLFVAPFVYIFMKFFPIVYMWVS